METAEPIAWSEMELRPCPERHRNIIVRAITPMREIPIPERDIPACAVTPQETIAAIIVRTWLYESIVDIVDGQTTTDAIFIAKYRVEPIKRIDIDRFIKIL